MTVKEASRFLNINEKKLYTLVKEGRLPGTKVTGKWLFPKAQLEQFVKGKALETVRKSFWESLVNKKVLLMCGSDDPVISIAQGHFHKMFPDFLLFSSSVGSREGIRLLKESFCTIAVSHLYDHKRDDFNFPCIREYFQNADELVVINLFYRTIGFVSNAWTTDCVSSTGRRARVFGLLLIISLRMKELSRLDSQGIIPRFSPTMTWCGLLQQAFQM